MDFCSAVGRHLTTTIFSSVKGRHFEKSNAHSYRCFVFWNARYHLFFFMLYLGYPLGIKGKKNVITSLDGWKKFISHFIFAQVHLYGQIHSMNEASSSWYISLLIVIWDYVSCMLSYIIISTSYFFFPFYSLIFQVLFFFTLPFSFLLTLFLFSFHPSF